jgi:hypothetical protein
MKAEVSTTLQLHEQALAGLSQRLSESELNSRELRNRLDAIEPAQIKQAHARVVELNKRLAQSILISATIEQVSLLLDHRSDPDGIKVVAWLSRKATEDPSWFKKNERFSLQETITNIKGLINETDS